MGVSHHGQGLHRRLHRRLGVRAGLGLVGQDRASRGREGKRRQIWQRFPKFILGYIATFLIVLIALALPDPGLVPKVKAAMGQANVFRGIFFVMTFFTIGVLSNFRKLWQEGIAKLAAVYVLCLFGYIIWVGLLISWLFFHGMLPPLVKG